MKQTGSSPRSGPSCCQLLSEEATHLRKALAEGRSGQGDSRRLEHLPGPESASACSPAGKGWGWSIRRAHNTLLCAQHPAPRTGASNKPRERERLVAASRCGVAPSAHFRALCPLLLLVSSSCGRGKSSGWTHTVKQTESVFRRPVVSGRS